MNLLRPDSITCRRDATRLWLHLLDRGIPFRLEQDPSEWGLADREVATLRRLIAEVDRLGAEAFDCYADAEALQSLDVFKLIARPTHTAEPRSLPALSHSSRAGAPQEAAAP